ncbi:MAG: hypothetical protein ABJZ69_07510, partial [Hyphomicrobiales bacterium]
APYCQGRPPAGPTAGSTRQDRGQTRKVNYSGKNGHLVQSNIRRSAVGLRKKMELRRALV